ncbi:hypothetical protein AVEN_198343-1, partial [Araneus ventricosus]
MVVLLEKMNGQTLPRDALVSPSNIWTLYRWRMLFRHALRSLGVVKTED